MKFRTLFSLLSCITLFAILTGCAMPVQQAVISAPAASKTLLTQGRVMGGQQPVVGATIELYAVGTGGDYSAATALSTPTQTDTNGNFSISSSFTCGASTDVFLTAIGGMPDGVHANPNLALMAALGQCSTLGTSTQVNINELSTVAAVSALNLFMSGPTNIGSSATYDSNALDQDFTLATQLVNTAGGTAPGSNVPSGYTVPSTLINTMGNILSACVNSSGGTAGDTSACGSLFALTTPAGGTAPTDTITAMLNLVNHPTLNTSALFKLIPPDAPFEPDQDSAPASYDVQLAPPAFTVTRSLLVEPDDGLQALYDLVNNATSTIDMTVYGLQDTIFSGDLVAACQRGVIVRVVMDVHYEKSTDQAAYDQLNAQAGCSAVWANTAYPATHEKSFVVDNSELAMLTLNVETRDYPLTRDFAILSNDPNDVASFEATFANDYAGVHNDTTTPGDDLIWSPTTAQTSLVGMINGATKTLEVENEEMSAQNIVSALEAACQRGVTVNVTMTNTTEYRPDFAALEAAGCGVHVYANSTKVLYIHAKVILADYGTSAQQAYMGSINFSTVSMVSNRELGMYVYDSTILDRLNTTLVSDYTGAPAY